ncbi:MAG: VOC family protein [Deltaproteobacteria bacterium]|nr:MAG: VOC family protein [Deltaproteobacteria bacterium]
MIRHIVHININVSDIERSVAFYRLLGFEVMHVLSDAPSDDVRQLMHFGGRTTRGAVMSLGDDPLTSTKIELLEPVDPPPEPQGELPENRLGFSRLALRTKNLIPFYEKLKAAGVAFLSEPIEIDVVGAKRYVLFRDPDGTLLELIEF